MAEELEDLEQRVKGSKVLLGAEDFNLLLLVSSVPCSYAIAV